MNYFSLKKYSKFILFLVPFLPIIFVDGFYYPYIIGRTLYFYILVILGLIFYFSLLFFCPTKYKPKFDFGILVFGFYVLVMLMAGVFGLDIYQSFWSIFERMDGLITLLYIFGYFYLLKTLFDKEKDFETFAKVSVYVSFFVSLYSIIQKFNILPVFKAGIDRAAGTIGNAAFLAGYLILSSGLALFLFFKEENKRKRMAFLSIAVIDIFVIFLTATRGAMLGLLVGFLILLFGATVFYARNLKRKIWFLSLWIIFISACFGFWVFRGSFSNSGIDFVRRVSTISFSDSNISNRLNVWKIALKSFSDNPVLGVGPENFYIEFNRLFTPEISEDWFDRTHNTYLDQLVHAGTFGFVFYILIWILLFYFLFKKRRELGFGFWVLTSFLVSYAVHNFFVFDTINTMFLFLFIFAWITFAPSGSSENVDKPIGRISVFRKSVILFLCFGSGLLIYHTIFIPYAINRNLYKGYRHVIENPAKSYENFAKNLEYSRFGLGETAAQAYEISQVLVAEKTETQETKAKFLDLVEKLLSQSIKVNKFDVRNRLNYGQYLIENKKDKQSLLEAEASLRRAVILGETRPEPIYLLFNLFSNRGEFDQAIAFMKHLSSKLPNFAEPYFHMANTLKAQSPDQAEEFFEKGMSLRLSGSRGETRAIVKYLTDKEQYERVLPYFEKFVKQNPESDAYKIDLAKIYYLNGRIDDAIDMVNFVYEKNPQIFEDQEMGNFANSLLLEYEKSQSQN